MGIVAKLLLQGRDPVGCIITRLLRVVGAFVGGFTYRRMTGREALYVQFDIGSLTIAVLLGVVILDDYGIGART